VVVWSLYVFSPVNKVMLASLMNILNDYFEWVGLPWPREFASLGYRSLRFVTTNISHGSVATRLRCGGMFSYPVRKFTAKSAAEIILKIGWYLAKLAAKLEWQLFGTWWTRCCTLNVKDFEL